MQSAAPDPGMGRTRQEIVRAQLARTGVDVTNAIRELREVLIGLAAEIDALDGRVKELERNTPAGLHGSGGRNPAP